MRPHPRCAVVLIFLLMPATAWANDHVASIFGALSFLSGSTHRGGHGALEVALPSSHTWHDEVGLVVDASVHGGTDAANAAVTKATLMFGVRGLYRPHSRLVLFGHLLGGGHRSQIGANVDNGGAVGAGGGYDILISRPGSSGWIFRNQFDWVNVAGENSVRASAGFGYRFR